MMDYGVKKEGWREGKELVNSNDSFPILRNHATLYTHKLERLFVNHNWQGTDHGK